MFKCKECGCVYKEKPDFCDCGNDDFEELLDKEPLAKENRTPKKTSITTGKMPKQTIEPYAIIIFLLCILFSLIILLFVGNPKENAPKTITQQKTTKTEIPSIDSLWNSSVAEPEKYNKKTELPPAREKAKPTTKNKPPVTNTTKILQSKNANKVNKPSAKDSTETKTTKTVTQPVPQTKRNTNNSTIINTKELSNYKIQLRNKIASKIDFTQVIGDGSCVVSFTISSDGMLLNRKFTKQSDNDTLNDVVFNAMSAMTSFSNPPTGYKGETLKLNVRIISGQFEVSLN